MEWAGVKRDAYNSAFKELGEKGYLFSVGGNRYRFYEAGRAVTSADNPNIKPVPAEEPTEFNF